MEMQDILNRQTLPLSEIPELGELSDGFHTFNSLYEQRVVLFAALVNTFSDLAWKSYKHEDGSPCFNGGWFIVGIDTPEGPYTYHYENKYWDMFHCKELPVAKEWDGHTDKDVTRLLSINDGEKSNLLTWAENEVRIACEFERKDAEHPEDWDYGCACYESALRAFKSLLRDGHSGFSVMMTKHILNRLIDGEPLRPIEDTDDVWNEVHKCKDGHITYQCSRMSSLFKDVYENGKVVYKNTDYFVCIDIHNHSTYHSGLVSDVIHEMWPIKIPYMPEDQIKVYCEDFLFDSKNGDFDTVGIFYAEKNKEKVEINRFFREGDNNHRWKEISLDEYNQRKAEASK